jgi:hypothetical protein
MRHLAVFCLVFLVFLPPLFGQEVTGSPAVTAQYRDPETIVRITERLAGRGRESWNTVIADGEPPLTWGSVAAFSLLLHECFDAQLTEAEAELVAKRFADSYESSDVNGQKVLADGWTSMLQTVSGSAAARAQVRAKLDAQIKAAADVKSGWGIAVREALERRGRVLQRSASARPAWAGAGFDAAMSVADLDASIELLYFMWVAAGRDPELVTLEGVAMIRDHFLQHFTELPADLQYALANGQKIYAGLRVLWYTGDARQRQTMARNFSQELNDLGLPDPNAGSRQQTAQSGSGSDAHAAFAADMVVGLAGSSYKSAW